MNSITISLRLPADELSPNSRCHWTDKADATKAARDISYIETVAMMARRPAPRWDRAMTQCVFYYKTACRHDPDNSLASCKAYFDGLVDAHLLADDAGLGHYPVIIKKDKNKPRVEITITKQEIKND